MIGYARRTWIVLWKDLLVERRSKESLNALLFFALLLLLLFQFALGPDQDRLHAALPGLIWLGFVLAGLLGLGGASWPNGTTTAGTVSGSRPATSRRSTSASWPPIWW
jgi:ABC-type transport system involved in cytochrome c biogenesis permease component